MICKICGNKENNTTYSVREMMYGLREYFTYFQCSSCECLQLHDAPDDMSKYYSDDFYAFRPMENTDSKIKRQLRNKRDLFAATNKGALGSILYLVNPKENLRFLTRIPINKSSKILDVGCGRGEMLYSLREVGFINTLGIDPFIPTPYSYPNGLHVEKKDLQSIGDSWNLITFLHAFEHIYNQQETMEQISKILEPMGTCVISIPIVSSHSWRTYRENWIQLDAPRHFFIHSLTSINLLASHFGLEIYKTVFNSTEQQFWGSVQYGSDIPLFDQHSYAINKEKSAFSKSDISRYKKHAAKLNKNREGDQAIFYLRRASI
jgi:2-polyprenyl-3-methyl-5-hydroxy-6-metoxy-1,4-benzoquinol methylase